MSPANCWTRYIAEMDIIRTVFMVTIFVLPLALVAAIVITVIKRSFGARP